MKKLKIYLDTSVISHLLADDTPDKMADTHKLWQQLQCGKYDVYLSAVTLDELLKCAEPKRGYLLEQLASISFQQLELTEEIRVLADRIIAVGILKSKSRDDCRHIAAAIIAECNYIVSWNFKHMVNVKTINGVRAITNLAGYRSIDLISPSMLIGDDDDEKAGD